MKLNPPKETVLDRFLRYVKIDTQSEEDSKSYPSTDKQLVLLRMLVDELKELGVTDAQIDKHGYVTGTVPSTIPGEAAAGIPTIGFIAHVDTSPAITGENVKPVVHKNYSGGDIVLPGDKSQVISPKEYPNLEKRYIGMDIVTSDGTTLLGADDKAGVAQIMTAVDQLIRNPDLKHGAIRVAFTPDEEIGLGTKYFDVKKFGADFAYTVDGGPLGEIEFETFNAFAANIKIVGVGVHPGYAKDKLVNAIKVFADIITRLPKDMAPETTEEREGYIHPYDFDGQAEEVMIKLLVRDFEMDGIEEKKQILSRIVEEVRGLYPKAKIDLEFKEQYLNMRYPIEKEPRVLEHAEEAIRRTGVEPHYMLIRGGTDGAKLTYEGLLTPNLFAGGEAFHSKIEWVPVQVMEKSVETILNLAAVWAEDSVGS
ncbi:MAG: peptidase T [Candidatus Latescibacterota bacterium]|nr:MAG: peptidase T [Candidatus Latescibacterota bacterium]